MRLTLRTLLAYLDDLLDEQQAAEIEEKIESSPRASELVHRVRNTIGQIRLDAPELNGKSLADDPNTVAEYLDNTLSPDQVPDFERVCLESDVHLGEVSACHQVLTLVLAEPANVQANLRNRIHSLTTSPQQPSSSAPMPVVETPEGTSHRVDRHTTRFLLTNHTKFGSVTWPLSSPIFSRLIFFPRVNSVLTLTRVLVVS